MSGIEVSTPPTKTTYNVGEAINMTGLILQVNWSEGDPTTVAYSEGSEITYEPTVAPMEEGTTTIAISYKGFTAYQDITVINKRLDHIDITTPPTVTWYDPVFNKLTMAGSVVTAYYTNGDTKVIEYGPESGLTYIPAEGSTISSSSSVTIKYTDEGVQKQYTYWGLSYKDVEPFTLTATTNSTVQFGSGNPS